MITTINTRTWLSLLLLVSFTLLVYGNDKYPVPISPGLPYLDVKVNGTKVRIQRIQDVENKLKNVYSKTSRPAPPFSIQPVVPVRGVKPIGELELITFIANKVSRHSGVLIDARTPKWYRQGAIPGSINIPLAVVQSKEYKQLFAILGTDGKDFANVLELVVYDNGPWCQQGGEFIKAIVSKGYPVTKIKYFRDGMQFWQLLGFTTTRVKR